MEGPAEGRPAATVVATAAVTVTPAATTIVSRQNVTAAAAAPAPAADPAPTPAPAAGCRPPLLHVAAGQQESSVHAGGVAAAAVAVGGKTGVAWRQADDVERTPLAAHGGAAAGAAAVATTADAATTGVASGSVRERERPKVGEGKRRSNHHSFCYGRFRNLNVCWLLCTLRT